MPPEFGRDVDRLCVLELARELDAAEAEPPDAAGELADAVSALRLATAGAIAAGPVVFERLDFRPLRISPLLPIAATQPRGEAIRLDALRARLAADLRERLPLADDDRELGEALDRWELSLFADEPFRSGQVHDALDCLLGDGDGAWAAADAEPPCCSARRRRSAIDLLERAAGRARGHGTHATRSAGRSSRRSCTATARSSSGRSTRRCSACARGRRACSRVTREKSHFRHGDVTDTSHLSGYGRNVDEAAVATTGDGADEAAKVLSRWSGSRRSIASGLRLRGCSTSCASSCARPRRGRGSRATAAREPPSGNFERGRKE